MQIYWILVLLFLQVEADVTLSTENSFERSAVRTQCIGKLQLNELIGWVFRFQHCEMTRDEDDERCGAICYPVVKPLLRYAALCQGKDATINDLKDEIRKKDVYIAQLESKLELAKSMETQASKQMEDLKVQLKVNEMLKQMEHLKQQTDAKIKSSYQQLKDKETELHLKAIKILKIEKDFKDREAEIVDKKDQISKMEMQTQSREAQIQSKDKSIRELEDQANSLKQKLKDISEASSCLPFTNSTKIHTISLPGIDPFVVPCNSSVSRSGWTVIQRRVNGLVDFNRNWIDYKLGFGDLRENFFLGLEKIHRMTLLQPHELYIQLQDVNGETSYARYDDFKIGSEEEDYKLKSLGKYSGTAGDSLDYHLNMKFSTLDRDNDTSEKNNCAKHHGGGWWFSYCAQSFLNGKYYEDGKSGTSDDYGIIWGSWQKYNYEISLTFSQIMIRPKTLKNSYFLMNT
ncbi:angiopoietin-related protein 7-like isoform X1 [Drosophila pseudoobscura]|uniref:Angiopoietin-related protein 7-like isoform X1 n=1 Tax=Drosophila pseudoobscura pseudoobscura TaxID=46245 RepID=A0A6I8UWY3_DROPS|nr:angiopoietin-related protein 7 isoform X1 [Drosophila pseudoobscura]